MELQQKEAQGKNNWSGQNTSVSVSVQNQSSSLAAPGGITLASNSWNDGGKATSALLETTGKGSKSDFSNVTKGLYSYGRGQGSGPQIRFSGFKSGQEYEVGFWIQTGQSTGNPDLQITDLSSGISSVACYYGLLTGDDFSSGQGKTVTLSGRNSQYFVKYSFTANSGSSLALSFHSAQTGTASIPTFDIGLIAISAVPEPSAFGLLAGLGSVALVASRRRRRR
ncbi:MAG: PEP-CTERM sorting domain-containing protein [Opitutales bacterium]|nr:PEP-CTERM sorting domain-containing protein [Opitutales bacterium]